MSAAPMIAVAGDLVEDIVVWANDDIAHGTDTRSKIFRVRGGSAANVATAIASHGGQPRLLTRVGDDGVGERLVSDLSRAGVETLAQRGGSTGTIVILIDREGERTMLPDRATAKEIEPFEPAWLDEVAWLHLPLYGFETPREAAVFRALCAEAAVRGVPVSVDVSSAGLITWLGADRVHTILDEIGPQLVFANDDEAALLALEGALPPPGRTVVVKHGNAPVVISSAGGQLEVPVPAISEVTDTTGAGDHFAAGFLVAYVSGAAFEAAARAGIAAASEVLRHPGAHLAG
ncbi:sugar/nucleoside kinase (ribokinase family) [Leucobacter luti]|uniref:carbohydrate kinase family protein n=2 Tax=Leucobacter luti TaxID=340320 RepID=UPI0010525961|nr:carbohydrate kinase family protein [Leucobacter luti]MCW2288153.1 sugar/nucleoside kinase (ribokinase family) [Leucobacter luti]TCK45685.1 sugar/nucleoside kinase (ribokinase family) [Leucobacter luti]